MVTKTDLATRMPPFVNQVPDIRTCPPPAEIQRCVEVLRWLEALPITTLIQSRPPKQNSDLVSVVLPMYNASRWIEMCLKGLLAQTHSNMEIFCVDDCSEDDTYERVVEQFGKDRRLCVVRLSKNVGPFQISNWVVKALARGKLIVWQDADDVSDPARIDEQSRWMLRHEYRISGTCVDEFYAPHVVPLQSTRTFIEADGMRHGLSFYCSVERTQEPVNLRKGSKRRKYLAWLKNDPAILRDGGLSARRSAGGDLAINSVLSAHATQILEKDLFVEFGGFYGRTKLGEDSEFDLRLLRFHSIGNIPKVLYSRRFHELSLTQHVLTGLKSPGRMQYRLSMEAKQEEIRRELERGNINRVRELCTEDLFCGDIKVERVHTGFDVPLMT